jgi:hypothetical protein
MIRHSGVWSGGMNQHAKSWNYQERLDQWVPPLHKRAGAKDQQHHQNERTNHGFASHHCDASAVLGNLAIEVQGNCLTVELSGAHADA